MSLDRPRFTRADLETLKTFDRAQVLAALGSFDDTGLDHSAFVLAAASLLAPERVPGLARALERHDPEAVEASIRAWGQGLPPAERGPGLTAPVGASKASAEAILAHRFTFYTETHDLPADLDWDHNPGTAHWGHDLNRFGFLAPLVRASQETGEARFARKAVGLILDWIAKCRIERCFVGTPYVFGSYLNEAIHCPAWAWCTGELLRAGQVEPVELLRICKSLHEQLAYLEIVIAGHAGNWPTIGCRGILATLASLPLLAEEERFARHALRTLDQQVAEQVLPDGVQDELTPHYHACVVDNVVSAAESAGRLGLRLEATTLATLRRMVHYQRQTVVPGGSGQVAFNDSDPEFVPRIEERLQALGLADAVSPPETLGPERFPYAGVSLLRQRADRGDLYLAFDGGPFGRSHQHEDRLGFWLFAFGRSFLVDPGRHLYDWSAASYLGYLRSSRAHSTVLVDGQGQHSQGRPDAWIPTAPTPGTFVATDGEVRAAAAYDLGYGPDNAIAVVHRREIVLAEAGFWVLFDRLEGQGIHHLEARFQFAPGRLQVADTRACTDFADANLLLEASGVWDEVHVECGQEDPRGGWYSPAYSRIEPAPALSLGVRAELPLVYAVLLLPYRGPTAPEVRFTFDGLKAVVGLAGDSVTVKTTLA
ncbi:MAG: alginate lyase family protein [Candidatus Latescibacterota bacterium]|jgi:hypothetical protein